MGVRTMLRALLIAALPWAQEAPLQTVDVHPDRTVTFRYKDPGAKSVSLRLEGAAPMPMTNDGNGVWSVTTPPLEPDCYGYTFEADGNRQLDPTNPKLKSSMLWVQNVLHVPGATPQLWDVQDVPHGVVHHHFFKSNVAQDQRDYFVYTPPGYEPRGKKYPVLYLLHGYSDDASAWTSFGMANVILDNLIAQGKAKPMVIVMPLGYGDTGVLTPVHQPNEDPALHQRNLTSFTQILLTEVIPQVETGYAVSTKREDRAIAGLSMGGAESLLTGLNHPDKFAWVGAFSMGGLGDDFSKEFPGVQAKINSQLRLLWISCGTEDRLIELNRKFIAWLKNEGVKVDAVEIPGSHTWMVWRRNLATLAPLLFVAK